MRDDVKQGKDYYKNTSHKKEGPQFGCSVQVNRSCSTLFDVKKLFFVAAVTYFWFFCSRLALPIGSRTCQIAILLSLNPLELEGQVIYLCLGINITGNI